MRVSRFSVSLYLASNAYVSNFLVPVWCSVGLSLEPHPLDSSYASFSNVTIHVTCHLSPKFVQHYSQVSDGGKL